MMTRMKRFSMMCVTIRMNDRKKTGAIELPHVFPSMQLGATFIQSNMILFQSSPVAIENNREKL